MDIFQCDRGAVIVPPRPELTDEGFLRVYMRIARTGTLKYTASDEGGERIAVVSRDVLFDPRSLDSFATKPVTIGHPSKRVDPENINKYGKGLLGHFPVEDGEFLGYAATITHKDAIAAVISKELNQTSCGYMASYGQEDSQGRYPQIMRVGNHVALCKRGRAGKEVAIALDEENADWFWQTDEITDDYFEPSELSEEVFKDLAPKKIWVPKKVEKDMADPKKDDSVINAVDEAIAAKDAVISSKDVLIADLQRQVGELKSKIVVLETRDSEPEEVESLDQIISDRLALWAKALPIFQKDSTDTFEPDYSWSENQIYLEAVKKSYPQITDKIQVADMADAETQGFVKGLFTSIAAATPAAKTEKKPLTSVLDELKNAVSTGDSSNKSEIEAAQQRRRDRIANKGA